MIRAHRLRKVFRRPRRIEGRFGALRTLVSREYVETVAVQDVSFEIEEGELVGYLGPNGAGKSTTVKMLTGVLTPTSGEVEVRGHVPWRDRTANAHGIGVVFGQRSQLWWDLPLIDSMRLIGALYDVSDSDFKRSLRRMSDLLGLDDFLETPVRQLSLGQRMRGDLAAAMLYSPPILYLDEPTVGLDVLAKAAVRDFIADTNRAGRTTVLLTTHDLDDVTALCRRIILIDSGSVLFDGTIENLISGYGGQRHVIVTLADAGPETLSAGAYSAERADDGRYSFPLGSDHNVPALLEAISREHPVRDLTVAEPELTDVIKHIYARSRD
ncbi:MAG TPA: ATP-binding cassette domain-containing protein [Candidatus Limnocylindrales bacterium]